MQIVKKNTWIFIYYAVLLIIMAVRTSVSSPPLILRLAYLFSFLLPLVIKYAYLYLPSVVAFSTININSFAFGFLPYDMQSYAWISILVLIATFGRTSRFNVKINPWFLLIILYVIIINVLFSGNLQNISFCLLVVGIGFILIDFDSQNYRYNMLNCFTVISLILSILYLSNYEMFLESYNAADNMERSGWTDPNYFSCVLGMGVLTSFILLLNVRSANLYERLLWVLTIIITLISQLLIASRGALLCVMVGSMCLFIFTKVKRTYKIFLALAITAFLIWLYSNSYFDLIEYRMMNDIGGGSGRMDIWKMKLFEFSTEGNILNWIFGLGYESAFNLSATNKGVGFHNDFLAIFCSYGLVGLSVFIYMLFFFPFKGINKDSRSIVIAIVSYLMLACLTLEPLSAGRLTFWAFYSLILLFKAK